MDFSLKLKQETKLILTQEMKTSMDILQMSSSKLKEFLEREAVTNPAIEINYSNSPAFKSSSSEDNVSPLDFISKEETLFDFLEEQISYLKLTPRVREVCLFIINNLDSRGYLVISKLELKKLLSISTSLLNEAFEIIYTLEPIGVGAENLKDCLKIQLKAQGIQDITLFKLIDSYLEEIANRNFSLISEELKISEAKILDYLKLIQTLTPIPARGYLVDSSSSYIVPEAKIEIRDGKLTFTLNEDALPKISINSNYSTSDSANKNSIYTAMNIMKCLEKRVQTLTRILEVLIVKQKEFFFKGNDYLKTLILKDLAKELNLHESTISRAIKNKYLETPQGIISMKSLFILNSSTIEVKNIISELITDENKKSPLSDEKISLLLKNKGFVVARRTVAKYREELGFPSTRERKK